MTVGGSIWLITSGFVLFDGIRVHSLIEKDVKKLKELRDEFQKENLSLRHNVEGLNITKNKIEKQNNRLQVNIDNAATQILSLTGLKKQYEKNMRTNEKNVENLQGEIVKLDKLKYELTNNLQYLSSSLSVAQEELKIMNDLKEEYVRENKKLQESNRENKATINTLKTQVDKLNKLYEGTKALLANLASVGDVFTEFETTIGDTSDRLNETRESYDDTLDKMNELLEKMKDKTFREIDSNNDNTITEKEFMNYVNESRK